MHVVQSYEHTVNLRNMYGTLWDGRDTTGRTGHYGTDRTLWDGWDRKATYCQEPCTTYTGPAKNLYKTGYTLSRI